MSFDIPEITWAPFSWPDDERAREVLRAYIADIAAGQPRTAPLDVAELDLRGAKLLGAPLTDAWFNGALLAEVDLTGADLRAARFNQADLCGAVLANAQMKRAEVSGANAEGADFTCASLTSVEGDEVTLAGATFSGADLSGVALSDANLQNADLRHATFHATVLDNCRLSGALLEGATGDLVGIVDIGTAEPIGGADLETDYTSTERIFAWRHTMVVNSDPAGLGCGGLSVSCSNRTSSPPSSSATPQRAVRLVAARQGEVTWTGSQPMLGPIEPDAL